jgi:hypothetical protein
MPRSRQARVFVLEVELQCARCGTPLYLTDPDDPEGTRAHWNEVCFPEDSTAKCDKCGYVSRVPDLAKYIGRTMRGKRR